MVLTIAKEPHARQSGCVPNNLLRLDYHFLNKKCLAKETHTYKHTDTHTQRHRHTDTD